MKHKLSTLLALVVLTMALAATGARAQTVANGPYYANPSWDQTLPSSTRFIVLSNMNNAAVLDRETGLVWERDPVSAHPFSVSGTWANATGICPQLDTGGRKGWRLPSVHELGSLIDPSVASGLLALPAGHPFLNIAAATYWSATASAQFPTAVAYRYSFRGGENAPQDLQSQSNRIWCVRGGGPIAVY